jgi:hypothetical protein
MLLYCNPFMTKMNITKPLSPAGVHVVEFTHMVMGPPAANPTRWTQWCKRRVASAAPWVS